MGGSAETDDALRGAPRLVPGRDAMTHARSPQEGFLLSRIDGRTSWAHLREIGGLPPAEVDRCLERWIGAGLLALDGSGPSAGSSRARAPQARAEALLDPGLDLSLDVQRAILEFEARLGAPYHEILGVERSASAREVKRAYFRLSREFHPDRYFRRSIGAFAARLDRVFRRILEAHEMLTDPMARAEVERSLADGEPRAEGSGPAQPVAPEEARRQLARFSVQARQLLARRQKAKHYFETGMAAFGAQRWLEAAASVRLAIAFDPANEAYRDAFGDVQRRAHQERAQQLVREAEGLLEVRDYGRALVAFEEALHFRPHDAELLQRAARLAWLSGNDLRRAKEWAAEACELEPESAPYRRTLGQIYQAAGLGANARRELRRALELEPGDAETRAALVALGRS